MKLRCEGFRIDGTCDGCVHAEIEVEKHVNPEVEHRCPRNPNVWNAEKKKNVPYYVGHVKVEAPHKPRKPRKKKSRANIWLVQEDARETGLLTHGFGIKICYSEEEACEFVNKRIWYFNPCQREWIMEQRRELGEVKAYWEKLNSAWLYCPSIRKMKINKEALLCQ